LGRTVRQHWNVVICNHRRACDNLNRGCLWGFAANALPGQQATLILDGPTNRWTGARIASFSTCLVRRRLDVIAAPGQLNRSATSFDMVKRIFSCALLLLLVTLDVCAQRSTNHAAAFNPSGDYHPVNRPNGSEQSIQFVLQVRHRRGRLLAWGQVRGVQPWYRFASVSVTPRHLNFSTVRIHGVRYDFAGIFLATGNFAAKAPDTGVILLRGTLRKFVNGRNVLQLNTSFAYYPGC
jgi:hypothetical protein